jgi:hypothetical protein
VIAALLTNAQRNGSTYEVDRCTRHVERVPDLMRAVFGFCANPNRQRGIRIPTGGFQDYCATRGTLLGFDVFGLLLEFLRRNTACWRSRTHEKPPLQFYHRRFLNDAVLGIKAVARCSVEDQRLRSRNGIGSNGSISGELLGFQPTFCPCSRLLRIRRPAPR